MALPDYFKASLGTAVVWGEASGSGVTKTLSLNNLAAGSGRMGVSADLGSLWDEEFFVLLVVETGTAPAAATVVELYFSCSHDNTNWPGKATGSDAAYPSTVSANKKQLGAPVAVLVATADGNTVLIQQRSIWRPGARYVTPVVINNMDQAIRNQGTPSNNLSRVYLVPLKYSIED